VIQTQGGFLISQIKQVQGRVFEHLLQQAEMDFFNGAQGRILYVLWQEDGLPIVEVSKRTGLAKTTLTGMLDRMESLGLIARVPYPEDRRQQRIVLMEKSKALADKYEDVSQQMAELFYREFQESEILEFETSLKKILGNLEEAEEASKKRME
jgi:DNA-binding MarR family transcriptional regulator